MAFEVTKSFIFDPSQEAIMFESIAGKYLRKIHYKAGVYIDGTDVPVLVFDNNQFVKEKNQLGNEVFVPIACFGDINGVVYNDKGDVILTKRKSLHIYPEPTSNMLGVKIIQEFINKLLIDNSAWLKTNTVQLPQIGTISVWQTPHSLHSILKDFILPEYENDDVAYDLISNILSGIKCSVREFIGDNKWIMHFQTKKGRDIVIEKSIDYRIHDWTEKTESGQW